MARMGSSNIYGASHGYLQLKNMCPCADCRKWFTAMELYSATCEDLAFDYPETLEEAAHKKPAAVIEFKKICELTKALLSKRAERVL